MGRVVITLVLVVGIVSSAWGLTGSGTEEDPWRITSLADFDEFASDPNYWDDYTRLETDVNLSGRVYERAVIAPDVLDADWPPRFQGTSFAGVFDGNDHKIIGLTINVGASRYFGLFGYVDDPHAEIRNLGLAYPNITAEGCGYVGSLVGFNRGGITNCHVKAGLIVGENSVGGVVGLNAGVIDQSYTTVDVNGRDHVGGLCGFNDGTINKSHATGSISGVGADPWRLGGLCGENGGTISNCYATSSVTGGSYSDYLGGLCGFNSGTINNCYTTGTVEGEESRFLGGLCGENSGGFITNCYWDVEESNEPNMCDNPEDPNCDNSYGKTTAEIKQQSTFEGWDFVNIWGIGENQTYPYLRTHAASDINKDNITNFLDLGILAGQWLESSGPENQRPEVSIVYPQDGARLMVGGVPPQTVVQAEANDRDGIVVRVEFFADGLKIGEDVDGGDQWSALWKGYSLGWHTLSAIAWDDEGSRTTSQPVNVEVWMDDPPPP